MSSSGAIEILIVCGAMALLGMMLIKAGKWPARQGDEPHCRTCEYLVAHLSSERCPECGASLAGKGTVLGQRPKRRGIWISGVMILLIALAWGGANLYRIVKWYELAPAWWVMEDVKSTSTAMSARAWAEMRRRQEMGKLSSYWEGKMVDAILAGNGPVEPAGGGIPNSLIFMWKQYLAGKLSQQQADGVFRKNTRVKWKVRPVVLVGQDVPYQGDVICFLPGGWVAKFEPAAQGHRAYVGWGSSGTGWHHRPSGLLKGSAKDRAGEYEVEINSSVAFYRVEDAEDGEEVVKRAYEALNKQRPFWECKWVDRLKFKVVEKGSAQYLKAIGEGELDDR